MFLFPETKQQQQQQTAAQQKQQRHGPMSGGNGDARGSTHCEEKTGTSGGKYPWKIQSTPPGAANITEPAANLEKTNRRLIWLSELHSLSRE